MPRIAQVDLAEPGERHAVTAIAGRHHAIEHVDAARDRFQHVIGRADAHQIARPILRQDRRDLLDHRQHHRLRLADREAADGITVKADVDQARAHWRGAVPGCRRPARSRTTCARRRGLERAFAALGPAQRQLHRALDIAAFRRQPMHSSSCIWISEPSSRCISIARSGDNSILAPSICERNVTAFSVTLRSFESDIIWKPPESVSIGPPQPVKSCSPPSAATARRPAAASGGRYCRA